MHSFPYTDKFNTRHIGPTSEETSNMLKAIGIDSIDKLINQTIPKQIRLQNPLNISKEKSEYEFINELKELASENLIFKSYIGMGYHPVITPPVILRNVLENPGWYTQYTPYQAEIAQGRLEALINFQTMVIDLTGMPIANASLLDEGTAAAEAMGMLFALRKNNKKNSNVFLVADDVYPQTLDVLYSRAEPLNIKIEVNSVEQFELNDSVFGILVQYPDGNGLVRNYNNLFKEAGNKDIYFVVAADLLSLSLLKPPGEFGADVVVGSSQRFGVPMGYGGPHAAFFATKEEFKRNLPGRIIGISVDAQGNPAFRMALQTREQHIRREKATSNICTAQVLLAVIAGMYGVYHGPDGIKNIAKRIHSMTKFLELSINELGFNQVNKNYFDTLKIEINDKSKLNSLKEKAINKKINFRYFENAVGISINETTNINDLNEIINLFSELNGTNIKSSKEILIENSQNISFAEFERTTNFMQHPVFNTHHSETEMLRYMKKLENRDLSLTHSMIPLGSCTMKLNATAEMVGVTFPEFANIHPFAPLEQTKGYQKLFKNLERDLCEITGLAAVSLQPNSGAQGEFTGLMVIREYLKSIGQSHRNIVVIPSSAHGTNPASAVMAGMKVVVVNCDVYGNVDYDDLKKKVEINKENLAALMITYPSTHGVFEENILDITSLIHENGGQVYMDGANMNAQVGLTSPMMIGADVCHLNLHKTFCIPHGGGGPGVGPVGVAEHLVNFLPGHSVIKIGDKNSLYAVSSAPWGSAGILMISYAYIKMMGSLGLKEASEIAILNANYMKSKLEKEFKVLYSGKTGRVAHELIFDMRQFKISANIEVEDIAKRLMDYGFHAPTVSFPVPGTLMVEPTESESLSEIDRFCDTLLSIREEIREIEIGNANPIENVLKNAPHTLNIISSDNWNYPYSREKAAFPASWLRNNKFWPFVGRVNNAHGDRNLICSCNPISDYAEETV